MKLKCPEKGGKSGAASYAADILGGSLPYQVPFSFPLMTSWARWLFLPHTKTFLTNCSLDQQWKNDSNWAKFLFEGSEYGELAGLQGLEQPGKDEAKPW